MSKQNNAELLEKWKKWILTDMPDAYEAIPAYMAVLDKGIDEARKVEINSESEDVNGNV